MKTKKIISALIIILILAIGGYLYVFKEHRDISKESAAISLSATDFFALFKNQDTGKNYLDKTVQLTGTVTEIDSDNFTLDNQIICYTDSLTIGQLTIDQGVVIKARSIGFDELLDMPKLDQTTVLKTKN